MNILMIVPRLPAPPVDGGSIYVYQTAKALADAGHQVTIAGFHSNLHPQDPAMLEAFCEVVHTEAAFKPYGVQSVVQSLITAQPITVSHRMNSKKMKRLFEQVPDTFDFIFLEGVQTGRFLPLCRARFPKTPVIVRQVNVEYLILKRNAAVQYNPFSRWFYLIQSMLMKRFETNVMGLADAVTSISDADLAYFKQMVPDQKYHVANPGIIVPKRLPVSRDPNSLLAIASWSWKPNSDGLEWFMEHVWPRAETAFPELHFKIVGTGLPEPFVRQYASNRVHFLGFVDDAEGLRQQSGMLVVPLKSGSGIKIKMLEAFASKIPVLATSFAIEGLPVKEGQEVMVFDSAERFIEAIHTLRDHQDTLNRMVEQAYRFASSWTWPEKIESMMRFLQLELIEEHQNKHT